jgi:NAD(P)-dependent dehydrogenase (short-subunit alcohol dehydrogenase family)
VMAGVGGKVVLITGGARGIGAETARALAGRGARLVLTDIDEAPLKELAAELGEDKVVTAVCDVCDLPSMEAAVARGIERFGGIDLVLANAGIASYGSVRAIDPAAFKRVLDINVLGVFHTVRAALPSLIERKGYVLVVSSLAAFAAAPGLAAYNASKAGVEHFANALRLEVAPHGVAVGSAHMSWIDTPLLRDAKQDLPGFKKLLDSLPGPLSKTSSVDVCVDAFVKALAARKRRVNVPGWVGAMGLLKPLITSRLADRQTFRQSVRLLPEIDAEVARMGRSTSARYSTPKG